MRCFRKIRRRVPLPFWEMSNDEHGTLSSIAPAAEGGYKVVDSGSVVLIAAEGT